MLEGTGVHVRKLHLYSELEITCRMASDVKLFSPFSLMKPFCDVTDEECILANELLGFSAPGVSRVQLKWWDLHSTLFQKRDIVPLRFRSDIKTSDFRVNAFVIPCVIPVKMG